MQTPRDRIHDASASPLRFGSLWRKARPLGSSKPKAVDDDPRPVSDPRRWWNWWAHEIDAYYPPDNVDYRRTVVQPDCLVAGTTVWTATGPAPIQTIEAGDLVLSQDAETGETAFKAVLAITERPPTNLLTVHANGNKITGSRGHAFWVLGEGWKMSKHLKVGDRLHTPNGSLEIERIEEAPLEKTYNLFVADFNTYFVGEQRLLVHDNTLWQPTTAIVPGLVE